MINLKSNIETSSVLCKLSLLEIIVFSMPCDSSLGYVSLDGQ